jgi:hypothetical protein
MSNQPKTKEIEWGPPDEKQKNNRNYKFVGIAVALIMVMGALAFVAGNTAAHTSFSADDVAITTNGGSLTSLTVAPTGDVHYSGLEAEPSSVDVVVEIKKASDSSWDTLESKSVSATGLEGSVEYDFSSIDVLAGSSLKRQEFKASDGATSTTDVDIRVTATLVGAGPNGNDVTATSTNTFTVSVENIPAGGGVGGKAGTNGS